MERLTRKSPSGKRLDVSDVQPCSVVRRCAAQGTTRILDENLKAYTLPIRRCGKSAVSPRGERFWLISRHQHIGRGRDEDLRSGLRSFPVGKHDIIYRAEDEDVVILLVLRGSRDMETLFRT